MVKPCLSASQVADLNTILLLSLCEYAMLTLLKLTLSLQEMHEQMLLQKLQPYCHFLTRVALLLSIMSKSIMFHLIYWLFNPLQLPRSRYGSPVVPHFVTDNKPCLQHHFFPHFMKLTHVQPFITVTDSDSPGSVEWTAFTNSTIQYLCAKQTKFKGGHGWHHTFLENKKFELIKVLIMSVSCGQ